MAWSGGEIIHLAIDVGASKLEYEIVPAGKAFGGRIAIRKNTNTETLLGLIRALAKNTMAREVCISLPGFVVNNRLMSLPNLQKVRGEKFMAGVQKIGAHTYLENDVKCMALAQWVERGRKRNDDFVLIAPGSGIGGAIVKAGKLVRGASNMAGEVGHMKMMDEMGKWREWEEISGGFGIEKRFNRAGWDAKKIFMSKEAKAQRHTEGAARWFGIGLANIAFILDPREIIIAGSIGRAYMKDAKLRKIVFKTYLENVIEPMKKTKISLSKIQQPALVGAALLAYANKDKHIRIFLAK